MGVAAVEVAEAVETIEALAEACGEALVNDRGERRYGGHAPRISGARWLARLGALLECVERLAEPRGATRVRTHLSSNVAS